MTHGADGGIRVGGERGIHHVQCPKARHRADSALGPPAGWWQVAFGSSMPIPRRSFAPSGARRPPARRGRSVVVALMVILGLVGSGPVVAEGAATGRADGADLWSLQPPRTPPVPESRGSDHPIDRFIDASLARQGLRRAPEADRRTLVRRAAWDLTGLPPTVEEVSAGLRGSPEDGGSSFDRLVERWLASPAYGELGRASCRERVCWIV